VLKLGRPNNDIDLNKIFELGVQKKGRADAAVIDDRTALTILMLSCLFISFYFGVLRVSFLKGHSPI